MGSNGTFNFTWTASFPYIITQKGTIVCSNGTFNFTWTASLLFRLARLLVVRSNGTFNFTWTAPLRTLQRKRPPICGSAKAICCLRCVGAENL